MNPLLREKPDGRRTAGYLTYLLGGLGTAAAIMILHLRVGRGPRAPARAVRGRGAEISPITQAASAMTPVRIAAKAAPPNTRSYRLNPAPGGASSSAKTPGGRESFDAIDAALKDVSGSAAASNRPLDVGGSGAGAPAAPEFPPLAPSFPPEATRAGGAPPEGRSDHGQLLGYRDASADPAGAALEGAPPAPANGAKADVLPRGTLMFVYLLTTVDTSNPAAVIQFGAARDVLFHRRRQLAFGTRFLGRLSGRPLRGRLNLGADTVLFPSGRELPVSASAVEADEFGGNIRPGVAAVCYPPPAWTQTAPYLSELFTGFTGLLESRAERPLTLSVGGVGVQTSVAGDVAAPLEQASAQAVRDFTQSRLKEIEDRYALYYLIPAGTAFWLQLDADLALPLAALSPSHAPDTPN